MLWKASPSGEVLLAIECKALSPSPPSPQGEGIFDFFLTGI
jgi:hypothetical protein